MHILQESLLGISDCPAFTELLDLPTPDRIKATLEALRKTERYAHLLSWDHWEHRDFLHSVGSPWVCPLPNGRFCLGSGHPHPGVSKYDPEVLILHERLMFLAHLKRRGIRCLVGTVVDPTLERFVFLAEVLECKCDEVGLNALISATKKEVCAFTMMLSIHSTSPLISCRSQNTSALSRPFGWRMAIVVGAYKHESAVRSKRMMSGCRCCAQISFSQVRIRSFILFTLF